jgi:hypothetical protein
MYIIAGVEVIREIAASTAGKYDLHLTGINFEQKTGQTASWTCETVQW